jgi:hypothetical protein
MAAGATYTAIATQTLSSAAGGVTFSSIPSTYTDVILVSSITGLSVNAQLFVRLNSDNASNYATSYVKGTGSTVVASTQTPYSYAAVSTNGTIAGDCMATIHFNNYSNTTTNKTMISHFSQAGAEAFISIALWRNTGAINAIQIGQTVATFGAGSTFTLYGILAA